jgi:hypothetical protein
MSVKLGIPIQFEESPFPISGLKGAILDMAVEIRESIRIIQDLERDKTKKNIIDTGFLDRVDVVRERRVIVGSMGGHTSGIPNTQATFDDHAKAFSDAEGSLPWLTMLWAFEKELYSSKFWPPVKFHKELLSIEWAKLKFLRESWMELKDMGLIVRDEAALA